MWEGGKEGGGKDPTLNPLYLGGEGRCLAFYGYLAEVIMSMVDLCSFPSWLIFHFFHLGFLPVLSFFLKDVTRDNPAVTKPESKQFMALPVLECDDSVVSLSSSAKYLSIRGEVLRVGMQN